MKRKRIREKDRNRDWREGRKICSKERTRDWREGMKYCLERRKGIRRLERRKEI
jgi:hypothetical protein